MNDHHDDTSPDAPDDRTAAAPATAELQALHQEKAQLEEQLRRTLADAANMRRRAQKEADDARRRIVEGITTELLPVLDNFELALQANAQGGPTDAEAVVQGVRMVQSLLSAALERHGLQEIPADGQPFDPARHEAVAVEATDAVPEGHIVRVLMKGYQLTDRVIRHSKVVVAGPTAAGQTPAS